MFEQITGSACGNCESAPAGAFGLFCSRGCRDEYEGVGACACACAEFNYRPVTRRSEAPMLDLDLFGPLPHQVDIFEVIATVEAEADLADQWPMSIAAAPDYGDELGLIDLFGAGQLALKVA